VEGGLSSSFDFDDLIQRLAVRAGEGNKRRWPAASHLRPQSQFLIVKHATSADPQCHAFVAPLRQNRIRPKVRKPLLLRPLGWRRGPFSFACRVSPMQKSNNQKDFTTQSLHRFMGCLTRTRICCLVSGKRVRTGQDVRYFSLSDLCEAACLPPAASFLFCLERCTACYGGGQRPEPTRCLGAKTVRPMPLTHALLKAYWQH
jgi:hypothetical protein